MFSEMIKPRFSDTDALGHVNNTMVPIWFEGARNPIFQLFTPDLNLAEWPLILAKIDVSFEAQIFYGKDIEIRSYISRIGGSSFDVFQELWQSEKRVASGTAVMVNFCYQTQSSSRISDEIRDKLENHRYEAT